MKGKRDGLMSIVGGLLLIAAALSITGYNLYENRQAESQRDAVLEELLKELPEETEAWEPQRPEAWERAPEEIVYPDYVLNPNMEMPVRQIEGYDYISVLSIPALEGEWPVMAEWDYRRLRINPCRYSGSAYLDDLVICAHNFRSHFGRLATLSIGDEVILTDMDGNVFRYRVAEITTLQPMAVQEMTDSGWPLTLFTCTVGGRTRVTVRCEKWLDG